MPSRHPGHAICFHGIQSIPNVGVRLEVRPVVDSDSRTASLAVQSTVTHWGQQPSPVKVGREISAAEVKEFGHENETTSVPASGPRKWTPLLPSP